MCVQLCVWWVSGTCLNEQGPSRCWSFVGGLMESCAMFCVCVCVAFGMEALAELCTCKVPACVIMAL